MQLKKNIRTAAKTIAFVFTVLLLLSSLLFAQKKPAVLADSDQQANHPPPPETGSEETIDFSEGINTLLKSNAKILQSESVVLEFRALQEQAKGSALPSWNLLMALAPVIGGQGNAVNGTYTPKKWGALFLGEADFVVPIFSFGRIRNAKKSSALAVDASHYMRQEEVNATIFQYKKLYLSLILLKRYRKILDDAKEKLDKVLEQAQDLYAQGKGVVQQKDLARLKIVSYEFQKWEGEWQLQYNRARLGLGHLLGKSTMVNVKDDDFPSVTNEKKALDFFVKAGYEKNPQWLAANVGVRAAELWLKSEKKINYPVIAVGARLRGAVSSAHENQQSPFAYDPYNFIEGTIYLGARWQFDFSKQKASVLKAQAKFKQIESQKLQATTGIPFEIASAYWSIEKFQGQWHLAMKKYKEATKWAFSELNAYALGATEAKDLLEAMVAMNLAAREMAEGEFNYHVALAELSWKVGEYTGLTQWQKK